MEERVLKMGRSRGGQILMRGITESGKLLERKGGNERQKPLLPAERQRQTIKKEQPSFKGGRGEWLEKKKGKRSLKLKGKTQGPNARLSKSL